MKRQNDFLVLTVTTPLPGTRYYEETKRQGLIEERDYGNYDFMHPIVPTKYLSRARGMGAAAEVPAQILHPAAHLLGCTL